jgi:RNA polymerase sigma factor (sigma-70 family)
MDEDRTYQLLGRWSEGDEDALAEILQRDLPWIRKRIEARCGELLRQRVETEDLVQEAMLEVLRFGPRFQIANRNAFRGLMVRIIENVIRGELDYHQALRREIARERPLPGDTLLQLGSELPSVTRPSQHAQRSEREAWVRLALELLDPRDRDVVLLRQWKELSFAEIAEELGISESGARMRFQRALPKIAKQVAALREGRVDERGNEA